MRTLCCVVLIAVACGTGAGTLRSGSAAAQSETRELFAQVDTRVRIFMKTVAHDVTQEGPIAWKKFFADSPAFFMANDGQLAFPNSAAAAKGIEDFAKTIKNMELRWGSDLRVDPLAANLASLGVSWREIRVDTAGKRVDEGGYFTGTAQLRNGRWQFRNAHWSTSNPPPAF